MAELYAQIVLKSCSLKWIQSKRASIIFLDLTSAEILRQDDHPSFSLWGSTDGTQNEVSTILDYVSGHTTAVFREDTFYWFTYDLQLHGYDINLKTWFRSPSLITEFPPVELDEDPFFPVLVDLHNGKFLVVINDYPGRLTIASLVVAKVIAGSSLRVSVENVQILSCDDSFFLEDGRPVMAVQVKEERIRVEEPPMDLVEGRQSAVMYFSGMIDKFREWYRFDPNAEAGKIKNIEPVAQLYSNREIQGGWVVTDEDDLY
ncbi:uncharacterized protein LOC132038452 [Lycium ferocissimum]|uniref:uncharacterized protein LOC132038452 n=1 Tax=Lycium ferocissimum TaxID=112874 RepID=UPI002815D620|nr:uncharacterized protein LOC132038452 [Lycium ferocissimum]